MATKHLGSVLHYIRGLAGRMRTEASTDGQLLQQFVFAKDETAFASLVMRTMLRHAKRSISPVYVSRPQRTARARNVNTKE
jgi:hypothetical protein